MLRKPFRRLIGRSNTKTSGSGKQPKRLWRKSPPHARCSTSSPGLTSVRAVFAAFLTTILFSISVVCGHRSAKLIGGTEANFWRLTCATLFLGIWAYGWGIGLGGQAFPVFLFSGIVGIGIG